MTEQPTDVVDLGPEPITREFAEAAKRQYRATRIPIADKMPIEIVREIADERVRQHAKWGEQNHPNGTGPTVYQSAASSLTNGHLRDIAKRQTDRHAAAGVVTFADILIEEVAEALAEDDPAKLRAELIQVAAVAAQWVEKIDRDEAKAAAS
ncbi:hypothetical protein [Arthrobacter sp. 18067]|uniref:hypothetical protein n=1 Tax=Arthrobacter sp. 18067 TaxID=2681413 RepID=UPI00190F7004|nr:hypothetical protein [Arthrobacter sp. 18067]